MSEWIDLSVKIKKANLVYPGDEPLELKKVKSLSEDGFNLHQLNINMHLGTHIDFKNHVSTKENDIIFEDFLGKANVIRPEILNNVISTEDVEDKYLNLTYQERILILDLHHYYKFNTKSYYECPKFEPSIFRFLKDNNINVLGADIPDFSYFNDHELKMHKDLLKSDIYLIENLTNLSQLTSHIYLVALPLEIEGVEASLVRAIAKNI